MMNFWLVYDSRTKTSSPKPRVQNMISSFRANLFYINREFHEMILLTKRRSDQKKVSFRNGVRYASCEFYYRQSIQSPWIRYFGCSARYHILAHCIRYTFLSMVKFFQLCTERHEANIHKQLSDSDFIDTPPNGILERSSDSIRYKLPAMLFYNFYIYKAVMLRSKILFSPWPFTR